MFECRGPLIALLALVGLLCGVGERSGSSARELWMVSGEKIDSDILAIENGGFLLDAGGRKFSDEVIVRWGHRQMRPPQRELRLRDGSILAGDLLAASEQELTWRTRYWGDIQVPLSDVAGIFFQPNRNENLNSKIRQYVRENSPADQDRLLGVEGWSEDGIASFVKLPEGGLGVGVQSGKVHPIQKVSTLTLAKLGDVPLQPAKFLVTGRDGSVLFLSECEANTSQVKFVTAGGLAINKSGKFAKVSTWCDSWERLDFSLARETSSPKRSDTFAIDQGTTVSIGGVRFLFGGSLSSEPFTLSVPEKGKRVVVQVAIQVEDDLGSKELGKNQLELSIDGAPVAFSESDWQDLLEGKVKELSLMVSPRRTLEFQFTDRVATRRSRLVIGDPFWLP